MTVRFQIDFMAMLRLELLVLTAVVHVLYHACNVIDFVRP